LKELRVMSIRPLRERRQEPDYRRAEQLVAGADHPVGIGVGPGEKARPARVEVGPEDHRPGVVEEQVAPGEAAKAAVRALGVHERIGLASVPDHDGLSPFRQVGAKATRPVSSIAGVTLLLGGRKTAPQ
jgi:hypothetical protein